MKIHIMPGVPVYVKGEIVQELADLLARLWRCNTDEERNELGYLIGRATTRWNRDPSNFEGEGDEIWQVPR